MTGDKLKFTKLKYKSLGSVAFGNNGKLKVIGKGNIELSSDFVIRNVLLVDNFNFNLLSISQLCDSGYLVNFDKSGCLVKNIENPEIKLKGLRKNNIYTIDLSISSIKCLLTQQEETQLWHRRLGHTHTRLISKMSQNGLVRGLPKLKFIENSICDACQKRKTD